MDRITVWVICCFPPTEPTNWLAAVKWQKCLSFRHKSYKPPLSSYVTSVVIILNYQYYLMKIFVWEFLHISLICWFVYWIICIDSLHIHDIRIVQSPYCMETVVFMITMIELDFIHTQEMEFLLEIDIHWGNFFMLFGWQFFHDQTSWTPFFLSINGS